MNEMRVYMQNMIVSDKGFVGCGLLFIGKKFQQATGTAEPFGGFRPLLELVPLCLTVFISKYLSKSIQKIYQS